MLAAAFLVGGASKLVMPKERIADFHAGSLRQAQTRIREALGLWLDREPATLLVVDQMPAKLAAVANRANEARLDAERAGVEAQKQVAGAAKALTDLGLSRRDAAELLGLSHQRIQQLVDAS